MANYNPRHVYVVSFDSANTDLYYFCSHSDIVLGGVAAANIFSGVLVNPSTTSQGLNPIRANATIGNISFQFIDQSNDLTALLNSKLTGSPAQGLRAKRVQHWVGEEGAEWSSGYTLLQTQQFYNSIGWSDNAYTFNAQDIQRSELSDIFDPKKTTLTSSLGLTGITINVNSSAAFSLVTHGGGYSDAPNQSVQYLKIQDEIIRVSAIPTSTTFTIDNVSSTLSAAASANATTLSITDHSSFGQSGNGYVVSGSPQVSYPIKWTGKTDSPHQLTGVTGVTAAFDSGATIYDLQGRGVLGTKIAEHTVDTNQSADKRTKVEEYIYLEMPAVQMLYAILTGTVYGSSPAATLPSHWNLGISAADWVATSEFTSIGTDLWDTSDDTAGFPLRFEGLKKTNAKSFIEKEILFICGLFTPILETGELGLRRMSGVVSDSAYSRVLDESNILDISGIRYDLDDIHNDFLVKWNYNAVSEDYTREVILTDSSSINKWGQARQLEIKALGLKGSAHTDSIIGNLFNTWRDRYAGPPFKATIQLDYSQRDIRIGDIVRIKLSNIPEFTDQNSAYGSLDISVEVQKLSINYRTGVVTIDVFGSTQRASPLVIGNPSLDDTFYTSQGSDISGVGTVTGSAGGGTFTITANSSLVGVTDLNSATATTDNDQGIFYYDGNLTINAGVTLTITNNVELRVKGTFTNNGTVDGIGGGPAGTATVSGTATSLGSTRAGGAITEQGYGVFSTNSTNTNGTFPTVGPFNIVNNDTSISGKPSDLRGTSGGIGGTAASYLGADQTAAGGNGGAGGAGLLIICRGAVGGANSSIDLSGVDGTAGTCFNKTLVSLTNYDLTFCSGSGAGGYPGGLVVILDGNSVTETITPYYTALLGDCPTVSVPAPTPDRTALASGWLIDGTSMQSYYWGYPSESKVTSNLYVHYLTESQTAAADTPSVSSLPTAIPVSEHSNTQNSVNVLGLELSATAPSDTNYKAARIYIKRQSTEGWHYVGEAASGQEVVFWVAADGATYDIKAHSVSITNVESDDYIDRTYTVSNGIETQIGTGSTLVSGSGVATNGGLLISGSDLIVYDSSGNAVQTIDLSGTGNLTGTGTMSGSAADDQLVPNNAFDFFDSSNAPNGWKIGGGATDSPFPSVVVSSDSPNAEGNYLNLPDGTGGSVYVVSKTFKLIPSKKYRVRIRAKHSGAGSPTVQDGFYLRLHQVYGSSGYFEYIDSLEYDVTTDILYGGSKVLTDTWTTYSYDFTADASAGWGSIKLINFTQSSVDFQIAWVEVLPWGIISDTDIGIFINDTTFANQGIQLDYNSGTPRMYVGNGDKKFLKFDGTDLTVGEEGSIQGASDYNDDTSFFHIPMWISLDGYTTGTTGSGTVTLNPGGSTGTVRLTVTTASGDDAELNIPSNSRLTAYSWTNNRKFKAVIKYSLESTNSGYVSMGNTSTGMGFRYVGGTGWQAFTANSSASPVITTTNITLATGATAEFILDHTTSPVQVRFYVNGSLVATHTNSVIKTGITNAHYYLYSYISRNSTGSTSHYIDLGEVKVLEGF